MLDFNTHPNFSRHLGEKQYVGEGTKFITMFVDNFNIYSWQVPQGLLRKLPIAIILIAMGTLHFCGWDGHSEGQ